MNVIETTAPIKIEELKKFFENKETFYFIDYTGSQLKSDKLLTYVGNLDIPCDIKLNTVEEIVELVKSYLNHTSIISISVLEHLVISLLMQRKGLHEVTNAEVIESLKDELDSWIEKLESLPLFNMYCIDNADIKEWVMSHDEDDTKDTKGINFVSLLKHADFYQFYHKMVTKPKYYSTYFNGNMFKGNNLYGYWANVNNPMFILTYGIATGELNNETYFKALKQDISELQSAGVI